MIQTIKEFAKNLLESLNIFENHTITPLMQHILGVFAFFSLIVIVVVIHQYKKETSNDLEKLLKGQIDDLLEYFPRKELIRILGEYNIPLKSEVIKELLRNVLKDTSNIKNITVDWYINSLKKTSDNIINACAFIIDLFNSKKVELALQTILPDVRIKEIELIISATTVFVALINDIDILLFEAMDLFDYMCESIINYAKNIVGADIWNDCSNILEYYFSNLKSETALDVWPGDIAHFDQKIPHENVINTSSLEQLEIQEENNKNLKNKENHKKTYNSTIIFVGFIILTLLKQSCQ